MKIVEYAVVGNLLKACSLALYCSKYSYVSSFDKSATGWFPSFYQNFGTILFLLGNDDKNYFLYLKVHLLIIFLVQNKLYLFL